MKKLKLAGIGKDGSAVEVDVTRGVAKLNAAQTDALLAKSCPDYEKGSFGMVKKAIAATQEALYPEVAGQMLKAGLDTDVSVVMGAGGMTPSMVITRKNSGERTDKEGNKIPWEKHAGVKTKFTSLKPSGKYSDTVVTEMGKKFAASMK